MERLRSLALDAQLLTLVERCLAPNKRDRYRDAKELAGEMEHYLSSVEARLRDAEVERAAADARSVSERRARRLTQTLAAVVFGIVLLGGGIYALVERERRGADRLGADVDLAERTDLDLDQAWLCERQAL